VVLTQATYQNYLALLNVLRQWFFNAPLGTPWSKTQSPSILEHHSQKLHYIRGTSYSKRHFLIRTYVYFRDAYGTQFYHPSMTKHLWIQITALSPQVTRKGTSWVRWIQLWSVVLTATAGLSILSYTYPMRNLTALSKGWTQGQQGRQPVRGSPYFSRMDNSSWRTWWLRPWMGNGLHVPWADEDSSPTNGTERGIRFLLSVTSSTGIYGNKATPLDWTGLSHYDMGGCPLGGCYSGSNGRSQIYGFVRFLGIRGCDTIPTSVGEMS
jgi:hypothetical protein